MRERHSQVARRGGARITPSRVTGGTSIRACRRRCAPPPSCAHASRCRPAATSSPSCAPPWWPRSISLSSPSSPPCLSGPGIGGTGLVAAASALVIVGAGTGVATPPRRCRVGRRSGQAVARERPAQHRPRQLQPRRRVPRRGIHWLDEFAGLADRGGSDEQTTSDISSTIQDFTEQAAVGGQLLMEAYRTDGDNGALAQVRLFTTSAAVQMSDLAAAVPDVAQQSFDTPRGRSGRWTPPR